MKVQHSFGDLDPGARDQCRSLIAELASHLEKKYLGRFDSASIRLETHIKALAEGKTWRVGLRLELIPRVLAARVEDTDLIEAIRSSFSKLETQLVNRIAKWSGEHYWKRPVRRARIGELLPVTQDEREKERRALYFKLIEDNLDTVYNVVRRELTYLECSEAIPRGKLSVSALVDATILKGLAQFEARPTDFSINEWLTKLALETIQAEARAVRRSIPEDASSLESSMSLPPEDPTEADQEFYEFYQPDDVLLLEDIVTVDEENDPETALTQQQYRLSLHRAMAELPVRWRHVRNCLVIGGRSPSKTADALGIPETEVIAIGDAAHAFLRQRLSDAGPIPEKTARDAAFRQVAEEISSSAEIPMTVKDRARISESMRDDGT